PPHRAGPGAPIPAHEERDQTRTEYPQLSVPQLFERQVQRDPEAVALICRDVRVSYRDLNRRANRLARHLLRLGVGPEVRVGIAAERSVEMIVGLLGTLKAGGAYVPLDPGNPPHRLAFLLEDAGVRVLAAQSHLMARLPASGSATVLLDRPYESDSAEDPGNPPARTTLDNLAYVMYTSGSTGAPKGVEIVHRGIVRLLFGTDFVTLDENQVFLGLAPFSFDASTFEIWGALLHGATCVLYADTVPTPHELGAVLRDHKVTTLWLTASLFNVIVDDAPEILSPVRQLLVGGEALSVPRVRRALDLLPNTQIINGYGPTENTTFTCCYRIPHEWESTPSSIPLGRPIANTQVYILDSSLQPVPAGTRGEICIGGDGLARGYLNRPDLTAQAFIRNPFGRGRLYKTGDEARYLPDGNIEFLGRSDSQVKIRGHRVELGEVEAALESDPRIKQAAVTAYECAPGDRRLAAYLVWRGAGGAAVAQVRRSLEEQLPQYMIPSWFQVLDALPLNANGKVDRRALPFPEPRLAAPPFDRTETRPLSFAQERLWFLEQFHRGTSAYNICRCVRLRGHLNRAALAEALRRVVERHHVLRTTFREEEGIPSQVVAPQAACPLEETDLSRKPGDWHNLLRRDARKPFDLARDPMLRALLLRASEEEHILLITVHHIAVDGWSLGILFGELGELYNSFVEGREPHLPSLPMQYADFAAWQRGSLQGEELARQLAYWKRRLAAAPVLELPLDHERPPVQTFRGGLERAQLGQKLTAALRELSQEEQATLFMTLLAGFSALLHQYTGQEDIVVGTPVANRTRVETEKLIGFFVNTLVLRVHARAETTFRGLLGSVREAALDAYEHQEAPFERLVEVLSRGRSLNRTPLFQVLFSFQNTPPEELALGDLEAQWMEIEIGTAKFDLTVSMRDRGDDLEVEAEYNADLFEPETIRGLLEHYKTLLGIAAANPDQPMAALPERARIGPATAAKPRVAPSSRPPQVEQGAGQEQRDMMEARLMRLWEDLLGIRPDSLRDDFFDLGGHSLLAVRLLARIQKEFGRKITLAEFFQQPTLAGLAAALRSGSAGSQPRVVVIQQGSSRPPFFCVDPRPMYRRLAGLLGSDQPFLGSCLPSPDKLPVPCTLEDLAAPCVEVIREAQPEGPYYLGGWSVGAALAYEVAQQLRARGHKVGLLVLFDGVNPAFLQEMSTPVARTWRFAQELRFHLTSLLAGGPRSAPAYITERCTSLHMSARMRIWSGWYRLRLAIGRKPESRSLDMEQVLHYCYRHYNPQPYPGRVILFCRKARPTGRFQDPQFGWGSLLTGKFEVFEVPGTHAGIFHEPNVRIMAAKLREVMLDAQARHA
ncbi:MAG: amino acid adenylation domain-containing protein, partial [Bryobacteraceae bacterium]